MMKQKQLQALAQAAGTCAKEAPSVPPLWVSRVYLEMRAELLEEPKSPPLSGLPVGRELAVVNRTILMQKEACRVK